MALGALKTLSDLGGGGVMKAGFIYPMLKGVEVLLQVYLTATERKP